MGLGWLRDRLSDVGDAAWDAVTDVADATVDAVGTVAAGTGDVIGAVGSAVDTATLGAAGAVLDAVDDTVLDGVDAITGGLVDVDFDGGNLSASVGLDGVLHLGAAVGEDGIRHSTDLLDQQFDLAVGDDGLQVSGQAGVDWGPLPFASGDIAVDDDGDITFEGVVQGTIPTPVGLLSGRAEADFVRDGDTWAASVDADGTLVLAGGGVVKGGVDAAYAATPDGSALSLGLEGSFTEPGVGTVGGSLGYDRIDHDGIVAERFEAGAFAEGYGVRVDAGVEHTSVTTPTGSVSTWDTSVDLSKAGSSPSADASAPAAAAAADSAATSEPAPDPTATDFDRSIAAADDVEASVDEMFGEWG
jgi:hypothetical protein